MKTTCTKMEALFVAAHKGNDTEAARIAGYKFPNVNAARLMKKPRVRKALAEKNAAMNRELGKVQGKRLAKVNITRNEIINILAGIARKSKSDSVRVSATSKLADIFRLSPRNGDNTEDQTGWTDDELLDWAIRGIYPVRFRRKQESSPSAESLPKPPESPIH